MNNLSTKFVIAIVAIFTVNGFDANTQKVFSQTVNLPKQIIIASNRTGGVANTMANGFASVLTKHVGTKATVRPVGNAAKWMGMIKSGDIDFGITSVTELSWAYWGKHAYTGKSNKTFSIVALGLGSNWAFMVPADTDVRTTQQLKSWIAGKKLTHKWINPVIDHLNRAGLANLGFSGGLKQAKVTAVPVSSYKVLVKLWVDRKVDFAGMPPGIPLGRRMNAGRPVRFIPMLDDPQAIARMQAVEPAYYISMTNRKMVGAKKGVPMLTFDYCMIARNTLDKGIVHQVIKTMYAHQEKLAKTHPTVRGWLPAKRKWATARAQMPYHPEAVKFYKSLGVWNANLEARQKELLRRSKS